MKKAKKKGRFSGKIKGAIAKKASTRGNYGYLKLPKGISIFKEDPKKRLMMDIIPYIVSVNNHPDKENGAEKGEQWYYRPFKIHRNIGADNEAVVCLTSIGKKCPICEYRAKLMKQGNADKKETDAIRPSSRALYNIKPKDKKAEDAIHIWDISEYCFQDQLETEVSENEKYENFPDLEDGLTLNIRFSSETVGASKPFAKANRIDFEERDEPYDESILEEVADLDKVLNILSYEELEKKFLEMTEEDDADEDDDVDDDDEDEEEAPKKKAKKKVKAPEPDDDDDDDDDYDADDDADDDEDVDDSDDSDDSDDDDDDDEDEEEAPPVRKKKTVSAKAKASSKKKRKK